MRTRNQSKRHQQSTGEQDATVLHRESEDIKDNEILGNISRDAVGKLLKRVKRGFNKEDISYLRRCNSVADPHREQGNNDQSTTDNAASRDVKETKSCSGDALDSAPLEVHVERSSQYSKPEKEDEVDDPDWEDGSIPVSDSTENNREELINGVTVEFDVSPGSAKRKTVRRATAQVKEVAELVHKAHLLCLLGRGRLIDSACNDALIQAALLSLLPTHLLKIAELPKLTVSCLTPIVHWVHNNFHVRRPSSAEKPFHLALASTLEAREGSPEEVAALSVALFRALNLTTRSSWLQALKQCLQVDASQSAFETGSFALLMEAHLILNQFVSILDVASLKPDADKSTSTNDGVSKGGNGIFNSPTLMVAGPSCSDETMTNELMKHETRSQDKFASDKLTDGKSDPLLSGNQNAASDPDLVESEGLKRKGDLEFEMQLKVALTATAIGSSEGTMAPSAVGSQTSSSRISHPFKRLKKVTTEGSSSSSNGISVSIGAKKVGAPLYWAEVFCSGENLTGKWVHVDAVNDIIDGEQKVEPAAAACKKSLRYVVAFAGQGAKDVTRRYCTKWYKIASQRINSTWWDEVLAPLKELESGASGVVSSEQDLSVGEDGLLRTNQLTETEERNGKAMASSMKKTSLGATRSSLEDMELETRALTEPLPTNQQAYKNHHLYAIERWLKKYEIMYPEGPVLGFCSGHPVYPRTCVQTLKTKERWLREGLQVKADELPAKVLKRSLKHGKEQPPEDDEYSETDNAGNLSLYGKWQTEPLYLPRAINGIVPKNERGRVDVWSEKCLPPGTVHLRLPRVGLVAKRLDIDYAPAMVGFEFRNGRSFPVIEGIVVCTEFKDAILEAYAEEEETREAKEKRKNEAQALSRWYQLLSSIVTRQRLNNCYGDGDSSQPSIDILTPDDKSHTPPSRQKLVSPRSNKANLPDEKQDEPPIIPTQNHEHEFVVDDQTVDEESSIRVKRCRCGFSIQFEEL